MTSHNHLGLRLVALLIFFTAITNLSAQHPWQTQNSPVSSNLISVSFPDTDNGYIATEDGEILNTKNGGLNWYQLSQIENIKPTRIFFIDAARGWLAGNYAGVLDSAAVFHTIDSGKTWQAAFFKKHAEFNDIFFHNDSIGWMAGIEVSDSDTLSLLVYSTDAGKNWTHPIAARVKSNLFSVHFRNLLYGNSCGQDGIFFKTNNGGRDLFVGWAMDFSTPSYGKDLYRIYNSGINYGCAVGEDGFLLASKDRWTSYNDYTVSSGDTLNAVTGYESLPIFWAVGNKGCVASIRYALFMWMISEETRITDQNLNDICQINDLKVFAVGDQGTILYYNNNYAPMAANDEVTVSQEETVNIYVLENDVDIDGHDLDIFSYESGRHGLVLHAPGSDYLEYHPDDSYTGYDTLEYVVTDHFGGYDTALVIVEITGVSMGPFEQMLVNFDAVAFGNAIWGDIDGDNDYDIIVCGEQADGNKIAALYWNENGSYARSDEEFEGVRPLNDHAMAFTDIDRDGYLDVIITGENNEGTAVTNLYKYNSLSSSYVKFDTDIPGVSKGSVDWGDFDNDGDFDLLISGSSESGKICNIYQNNGRGQAIATWVFSKFNFAFTPIDGGSARFIDFNRDNYLDVISIGTTELNQKEARYYTNSQGMYVAGTLENGYSAASVDYCDFNSDGLTEILFKGKGDDNLPHSRIIKFQETFVEVASDLTGLSSGSADWGDYDNDGDYDLLMCGMNDQLAVTTILYQNNNGVLENSDIFLPGMASGTAKWGDYDADGDLDILMSGYFNSAPNRITTVFKNNSSSANELPGVASQFKTDPVGNAIKISWEPANDHETPANGLAYNLRIKRNKFSKYDIAPISNNDDFIAVANYGNASDTSMLIEGLEPGALYSCDLQTIDASYQVSPWAEFEFNVSSAYFIEQDYTLPSYHTTAAEWFEYNEDGVRELLFAGWSDTDTISHLYTLKESGFEALDNNFGIGLSHGQVEILDFNNDNQPDFSEFNTEDSTMIIHVSGVKTVTQFTGINDGTYDWGDYDADGDADLVITGRTEPSDEKTQIYRNDNGMLTFQYSTIPGVIHGEIRWVDIDNDGDLDIAITGLNTTLQNTTRIYENKNGGFIQKVMDLPGLSFPNFDFSDYDNDGDLDMLICGMDGLQSASYIYKNENGNFSATTHKLQPIKGDCRWVDLNNDGLDDIVFSGLYVSASLESSLLTVVQLNSEGTYTKDIMMTGLNNPIIAPGDFDGDNKIDLLIAGQSYSLFYKNVMLMENEKPEPPAEITAIPYGDSLKLSWRSGFELQGFGNWISHNIRMGTTPGGSNIISPLSYANGDRKVVKPGNVPVGTTKVVKGLSPDSTYYIAIQSVDHTYLGSAFSEEMVFSMESGSMIPDNFLLSPTGITSARWVDYDSDNDLDLLVRAGEEISSSIGIYLNNDGVMNLQLDDLETISSTYDMLLNDIDKDNDPDLLLLSTSNAETNQMLINDAGVFAKGELDIEGFAYSNAAWGDYNNDGDNDLLIMGHNPEDNTVGAVLYENSAGEFETAEIVLEASHLGEIHWVDIDNDGDKDLVRCGYTKVLEATAEDIKFSVNINGGGAIGTSDHQLPGLVFCSLDFGDYDNDGDLDLLYTGASFSDNMPHSYICTNTEGNFEITDSIIPIFAGSARWFDYNNDGNLDIVISGYNDLAYKYRVDPDIKIFSGIFLNMDGKFIQAATLKTLHNPVVEVADYDGDGRTDIFLGGFLEDSDTIGIFYRNHTQDVNLAPGVPGLNDHVINGEEVEISWGKVTDQDNESNENYYNLRVGTSPGGNEVLSSLSHDDGTRKIVNTGNMQQATSYTLQGLAPSTTYYYAIQSIDKGLATSGWSDEKQFTTEASEILPAKNPAFHVNVYPVPAHEQVYVELFAEQTSPIRLEVFDETGRMLQTKASRVSAGRSIFTLPFDKEGFYLLKVHFEHEIIIKKILVLD